jgi:hypothetical protein
VSLSCAFGAMAGGYQIVSADKYYFLLHSTRSPIHWQHPCLFCLTPERPFPTRRFNNGGYSAADQRSFTGTCLSRVSSSAALTTFSTCVDTNTTLTLLPCHITLAPWAALVYFLKKASFVSKLTPFKKKSATRRCRAVCGD